MLRLNMIDWIAVILLAIGGINWGLIGLFDYNLVAAIFGDFTGATRFIYDLVGIAAVYLIISLAIKSGE